MFFSIQVHRSNRAWGHNLIMRLLNEKLIYRGDWLLADYLNYEIVDDDNLDVRVRDLDEKQAQLALALSIREIRRLRGIMQKIKNLTF